MLKDLHIKNLVLMESCSIEFHKGLNILTGETGSGKTAILQAIKLLLGQKLDPTVIRSGEKKGSIQARFTVSSLELLSLLAETGIEIEEETLILYREVSIEGKSKNFINDRMVSSSFLQKVGSFLIQVVDQSSHHELKLLDRHRDIVDLFGLLEEKVQEFSLLFEESKRQKVQLQKIEGILQQKQREWDFCYAQQKELESLSFQDGEEEAVFQEYTLFSKSQEVQEKTKELLHLLSEGPQNAIKAISCAKNLCHNLLSIHKNFKEGAELLEQSILSIEETLYLLRHVLSMFETDPKRHQYLEEKLHHFHQIRRKYGPTPQD